LTALPCKRFSIDTIEAWDEDAFPEKNDATLTTAAGEVPVTELAMFFRRKP
jgi:hypothetical protein